MRTAPPHAAGAHICTTQEHDWSNTFKRPRNECDAGQCWIETTSELREQLVKDFATSAPPEAIQRRRLSGSIQVVVTGCREPKELYGRVS